MKVFCMSICVKEIEKKYKDAIEDEKSAALIDEPVRINDEDKNETAAGLKSNKFLKSEEPPLQRKSKVGRRRNNSVENNYDPDPALRKEDIKARNERNAGEKSKNKLKKNRALEYKAGLKTSVEQSKFPVSEYQREYEWKKNAIGDSPLLNAEKVVFDSHTNIPRFVRDKVPRKTEYQSRFAAESEKQQVSRKQKKENEEDKYDVNPTSPVKRLLETSHNPDPPFFPHGSNRVMHTEYQANFGSPKKYDYKEGIWLGAKPPHLLPDEQSTTGSSDYVTNWFEEVLELRAKARDYKIRAIEGNYFSREFLAQLDAELVELYAEKEKANSHSTSGKKPGSDEAVPSPRHLEELERPRPRVKHAWEECNEDSDINDGEKIYRSLNAQFKDVDSEAGSSRSGHGSFHSEGRGHKYNTAKNRTKPPLSKTVVKQKHSPTTYKTTRSVQTIKEDEPGFQKEVNHSVDSDDSNDPDTSKKLTKPSPSKMTNQKHSAPLHKTTKSAKVIKEDGVLLRSVSSGSEASSELSEERSGTEISKGGSYENPDKFNMKYIQGMHSNDAPSTSVRSNCGSESERQNSSGHDSSCSCLSAHSSLASRESVARQTLAHAKQRRANFWRQ